jgi:hypothetical protein
MTAFFAAGGSLAIKNACHSPGYFEGKTAGNLHYSVFLLDVFFGSGALKGHPLPLSMVILRKSSKGLKGRACTDEIFKGIQGKEPIRL